MAFDPNPALGRVFENAANPASGDRVTMNGVVEKTAITIGILILSAIGTWAYLHSLVSARNDLAFGQALVMATPLALVTLALSIWISFRKKVSAIPILIFSVAEGAVIGAYSYLIAAATESTEPVMGAISGTFVAVVAVLIAYRFFNISASPRLRRFVFVAMIALVLISVVDFILLFSGNAIGVNGLGGIGLIFSLVGLVLGLLMVLIDFSATTEAIENGLPAAESWRLAYGFTVSMVWIYMNLLRILAIFRD